jgi:hypothetical protein
MQITLGQSLKNLENMVIINKKNEYQNKALLGKIESWSWDDLKKVTKNLILNILII